MTKITTDEWLTALGHAIRDAASEGLTMQEIIQITGRERSTVQRMVREAVRTGKVELAGYRQSVRIDGVTCSIPAYRLVKRTKNSKIL